MPEPLHGSSSPFVSVIVPVRDDVARLRLCLQGLLEQSYPADRFEVVVVDNGSEQDHAPALPDDDRFRLVEELRPGSYAARNAGIAVSGGTVLAFTDADCLPQPSWLAEAVAELVREPAADMVGGEIELFFDGHRPRTGPEIYEAHHGFRQESYVRDDHFAATGNMVTWRSTMDRVGAFDGLLRSNGDVEWGRRVAAAGGVQRYAASAVVKHPARATWSQMTTKVRRVAEGRRDNEIRRGCSRLYLFRFGLSSVWSFLRACLGVWRRPFPASPTDKLRYLAACGVSRLLLAGIFWRAALRRRLRAPD